MEAGQWRLGNGGWPMRIQYILERFTGAVLTGLGHL